MAQENSTTRRIVVTAMLTALAFVAVLIGKLVPNVLGFLSYDPKDAVVAIAGFMYGPLTAVIISVLVSVIEMLTVSTTGVYGLIMNVVSTLAFALPAALFYKRWRNMKGAILGLVAGMICMTLMMLLWNYIITPIYMGYPREAVAALLLPAFLPFNLLKSVLNAAFAFLLYKPLSAALRKAGLLEKKENAPSQHPIGLWIVTALVIVTGVLMILVLQGKI